MLKNIQKPYKFIILFLAFAFALLISWSIIYKPYLYFLVGAGNPVWSVLGFPVKMELTGNTLHFIYIFTGRSPLSFTVHDANEIYMNLILLISLMGAARVILKVKLLKPCLISIAVLFLVHIFVLYAYAYTHIWTFVDTQNPELQNNLLPHISVLFSRSVSDILNGLLFHWNTWGWDVLPLALWLGSTRKSLSDLMPRKKSSNNSTHSIK